MRSFLKSHLSKAYCWWFRNPANQVDISKYIPLFTRGFIYPRWLALGFLNHQLGTVPEPPGPCQMRKVDPQLQAIRAAAKERFLAQKVHWGCEDGGISLGP